MAYLKLPDHTVRDLFMREFTNEEALTWLVMLCIASREVQLHRGFILTNRRAMTLKELAMEARITEEVASSAIQKMMDWDMVRSSTVPGTEIVAMEIVDWDYMQIDRRNSERKREQREREAKAQPAVRTSP